MAAEGLLLVFVGVTALALTIQALSVWKYTRYLHRLSERLERRSQELEGEVRQVVQRFEQLADDFQPLTRVAEKVSLTVEELNQMVHDRARDLDAFVAEVMDLGRQQAEKVDFVVSDTVQKFQQTTEIIQKDLLRPALEISSFLKGIQSGLDYLLSKKPPRPAREEYSEEELFI